MLSLTSKATAMLVERLRSSSETEQFKAGEALRIHVESEARVMSGEVFYSFMNDVSARIFILIKSPFPHEIKGGIIAVSFLIDFTSEENETMVIRFANYLRIVFQRPLNETGVRTLELAAKELGHLARCGGLLTNDFVDFEVRRALEWLQSKSHLSKRLAAVLVLKELAENAPVLFFVHMAQFFDHIRKALHDSDGYTREAATLALRACLTLISRRESNLTVEWYYKVYESARFGFQKGTRASIHGSLLIFGELIQQTGNFMIPRFDEVCQTILQHKNHKDKLVRVKVISLLPDLAKFSPDAFVRSYLDICLEHLFLAVNNIDERDYCFESLGGLSLAVGKSMLPYLPQVMVYIRDGLTSRRNRPFCKQALKCVSMLAQAVGPALTEHNMTEGLLEQMFGGGLTPELVQTLVALEKNIPFLRQLITAHILHALCLVLAGVPYTAPPSGGLWHLDDSNPLWFSQLHVMDLLKRRIESKIVKSHNKIYTPINMNEQELINLALQTLREFKFSGVNLLSMLEGTVLKYVDDQNAEIRRQAAKTLATVVLNQSDELPRNCLTWKETSKLITSIVKRLLTVGVADPVPEIRADVLATLDSKFDIYLVQADSLEALFTALNDEVFKVRRIAMGVATRLVLLSPAHVLPALRKCIIKTMSELSYSHGDPKRKEEAALLLGDLIYGVYGDRTVTETSRGAISPGFIGPFTAPMIRILLDRLKNGRLKIATAVLRTLGEIALVDTVKMSPYMPELIPLIIEILRDHSSVHKRQVALRTLSLLVRSTGQVITPMLEYPELLDNLLEIIKGGTSAPWKLRRAALEGLGTLGALDPFRDKMSRLKMARETAKEGKTIPSVSNLSNALNSETMMKLNDAIESCDPYSSGGTNDDFYPTVAINALNRILNDSTLGTHHSMVVQSVTHIFRSLGLNCTPYLPQIMPRMLLLAKDCEYDLRRVLFQHFAIVVTIVKQFIRPYLPEMFDLVEAFWFDNLDQVLILVEQVSSALREEAKQFVQRIISQIIEVLQRARDGLTTTRGYNEPVITLTNQKQRKKDSESETVEVEPSEISFPGQFDSLPSRQSVTLSQKPNPSLLSVEKTLQTIRVLGVNLSDHFFLLIPALIQVVESDFAFSKIRSLAMETMGVLSTGMDFKDYLSSTIQSLTRILLKPNSSLKAQALDIICTVAAKSGTPFLRFVPTIDHALEGQQIPVTIISKYRNVIREIQEGTEVHVEERFDISRASHTSTTSELLLGGESITDLGGTKQLQVNQPKLKKAWEAAQRSTKDDWTEWMRRLSVELLRESPSPALRACSALAQVFPPLSRELFNAAFVSCWTALGDQYREYLVRSLEAAFQSPNIPPETLQTLLNLAEFMEHIETVLPIDIRDLGNYAQKCHAYAKALHYKELVFRASPGTGIEDLISINNKLEQPEAAFGILHYVQQQQKVQEQRLRRQAEELKSINERDLDYYTVLDFDLFNFGVAGAITMQSQYGKMISSFSSFASEKPSRKRSSNQSQADSISEYSKNDELKSNVKSMESGVGIANPDQLVVIGSSQESSESVNQHIQLKESWFEQLGRWEEALEAYDSKLSGYGENELGLKLTLGKMRCWSALGEYEQLSAFSAKIWPRLDEKLPNHAEAKRSMAPMFAQAAWVQNNWKKMEEFSNVVDKEDWVGSSLRSILALQRDDFQHAKEYIDNAHRLLDTELSALVGESYNRAYRQIVLVQQLAELNEIYKFKQRAKLLGSKSKELERVRKKIHTMWAKRLRGCQENVSVWELIMSPRTLIIPPKEDIHTWIKFSTICRKSPVHRRLAMKALERIGVDPALEPEVQDSLERTDPNVTFAYLKYLWEMSKEVRIEPSKASDKYLIPSSLRVSSHNFYSTSSATLEHAQREVVLKRMSNLVKSLDVKREKVGLTESETKLLVRCRRRLGNMHLEYHDHQLSDDVISKVLKCFQAATEMDEGNYKAWNAWASMNFEAVEHYQKLARAASTNSSPSSVTTSSPSKLSISSEQNCSAAAKRAVSHIVPALRGFFHAIILSKNHPSANVLQDILRLLTLWFDYGARKEVNIALREGVGKVAVETWLAVIPQLIARIHTPNTEIKQLLQSLLIKVGKAHPQALVYPLTVASKSANVNRKRSAQKILKVLRENSETARLVDQAQLVSHELIRVAILWPEEWNQALEEASTYFFNAAEKDIPAMLNILEPLHAKIIQGVETEHEREFLRSHGRDLRNAADYLRKYKDIGHEEDIHQAWELYYQVFRKICKEMQHIKSLNLEFVSPALLRAHDLELAVPGTYQTGQEIVRIQSFEPFIKVIGSKQRPRQITIKGSDGTDYQFLLKGHEDLRQDERVMQLFGLVNRLLAQQRETSKHDLSIQRYEVIPLSHDVGISGWLPDTDTLHQLIHDFRKRRHVLLDIEQRLMKKIAPDMEQLTVIQKVEVFCHALSHTTGQDLCKVLWLKSRNSEVWLDRRTNFTRSLATMSMVGYILGLGDRHPSNLMLDRTSGKIIHIDFGDCFEAAIHREKLPEKVPFRLTRMLIAAMEVSGVEGNYRSTCEAVMKVLRAYRGPVMAMLEAFVHDPLINWRLLTPNQNLRGNSQASSQASSVTSRDSTQGLNEVEVVQSPSLGGFSRLKVAEPPTSHDSSRLDGSRGMAEFNTVPAKSLSMKPMQNDIGSKIKELNARVAPGSASFSQRPRAMTEGFLVGNANDDEKGSSNSSEAQTPGPDLSENGQQVAAEMLNERALAVIERVLDKLTGKDFGNSESLSVPDQVQKLIVQATSYENLCVAYVGWCPCK